MRKILVLLIVLLLMTLAALPAIDGFFFKRYFQNYLTLIQNQIPNKADVNIQLSSYEMGYLSSTAKIIVTMKEDTKDDSKFSFSLLPKKYGIDMVVQHGPLASVDGKLKPAYAYVTYSMKVPYFENTSLTANTVFALFTNKITTNYSLGNLNIPKVFKWDGFHGELITSSNGKDRFISTFNLGKIESDADSSIKLNVSPMQFYSEIMLDPADHSMTGKSNTYSDGMNIDTGTDMKISMKKMLFNSSDSIKNDLYQYQSTLHLDQLVLPLSQSIEFNNFISENKLSNIKLDLPDDMNQASYTSLLKESITPTSMIETKTTFDTSFGHTDINASVTDLVFSDKPKDNSRAPDLIKYNLMINAVIPKELFSILLNEYFSIGKKMQSYMMLMLADKDTVPSMTDSTDSSTTPDSSTMLAQWVEKGILVEKDNNYSLTLSMTPTKIILNGTTVEHPEELFGATAESSASSPQKTCISYMTNVYGQMVCSEYSTTPASQQPAAESTPAVTTPAAPASAAEPTPATAPAPEPAATPAAEAKPAPAPEPAPAAKPEPAAPTIEPEPAPTTKSESAAPAAAPEPAAAPAPAATPKPAPAAAPTPPPAAKPEPAAAPALTYGCYWQQHTGGVYTWVLIKELDTKDACFNMDTCNGGKGASKGGCFKWATSAEATGQPWQ